MATCAHSLKKSLKRFLRAVHAGASGFELVNPAGRWASVLSSRVRPSQRENSTPAARVLTCTGRVTVTPRNGP